MAYQDSGAVIRADLNIVLEEAGSAGTNCIGQQIFPILPVAAKDGTYPKWRLAKGELLNADDVTIRTPSGTYNRVVRSYETATYSTKDRGLEELVDDSYAKDVSRFFQAEATAARFILRQMLLAHEARVSAAVMNSSNFTATAAAVDYTEANLATINIVKDVQGAKKRLSNVGVRANTMVIPEDVYNLVIRSTLLQNYIRGNRPSDSNILINETDLAGIFKLDRVLIGTEVKNGAKKGQSFSASAIWPNTYIWIGRTESGDFQNMGAGRTIVWSQEGGIFVPESYRDEARRSNVVRVRQHTAEEVIDTTAGQLITTNYA